MDNSEWLNELSRFANPGAAFARWQRIDAPDAWQDELLNNMLFLRPQTLVAHATRQTGKSVTVACGAALRCEMVDNCLIALVAPSVAQAGELKMKVSSFRDSLLGAQTIMRENDSEIRFGNGSRLVIKPAGEKTGVRGLSRIDTLIVDEAARIVETDWAGMLPAVNEDTGQLVLASTPWSRSGMFQTQMRNPNATVIHARATEIPRRAAYVERQRGLLSDREFQREIMLEPSAAGQTFFSLDRVDQSIIAGAGLVL